MPSKKIPSKFSKKFFFNGFFENEHGLISKNLSLILLVLCKNSFSSCVNSRRDWDQAWYGLQVCSERRKWEAESEGTSQVVFKGLIGLR